MKTCNKCKEEKPFEEFNKDSQKKDGRDSWCKDCRKEYNKEYNKEYYTKNKDQLSEKNKKYRLKNKEYYKEYYTKNKEQLAEKNKEYRLNNKEHFDQYRKEYYIKNKDKISKQKKEYRLKNRDKIAKIKKEYCKRKPHVKSWRNLLHNSLTRLGKPKQGKAIDLLGYSAIDLKHHLEALFTEGMTWENRSEWHIDHIIPVSAFKKDTPPYIVNRLDNLRPIWAEENLSKNAKYNEQEVPKEMLEYIEE